MKRLFDFVMAVISILLFAIPMLLIFIAIRITSKGPVLYWSDRIGKGNVIFMMPKFRSMRIDAPVIATHLMTEPGKYLTLIGRFLRRTSLDELPQLFSILKGDMSFVGPRPALFNQDDLIMLRKKNGLDQLVPGLTGLAQVSGRDELSISNKVDLEIQYLNKKSFWFDIKILWITISKIFNNKDISH